MKTIALMQNPMQVMVKQIVIRKTKTRYDSLTRKKGDVVETMLIHLGSIIPGSDALFVITRFKREAAELWDIFSEENVERKVSVENEDDTIITQKALKQAITEGKIDEGWLYWFTYDPKDKKAIPARLLCHAYLPLTEDGTPLTRVDKDGNVITTHMHGIEVPIEETHLDVAWLVEYSPFKPNAQGGMGDWTASKGPERELEEARRRMYAIPETGSSAVEIFDEAGNADDDETDDDETEVDE